MLKNEQNQFFYQFFYALEVRFNLRSSKFKDLDATCFALPNQISAPKMSRNRTILSSWLVTS